MSRLQRHATWAWLIVLILGLLVAAAMRLGPGQVTAPASASPTDTDGAGALAATAQRVRLLQLEISRLREQLSSVQSEADNRRDHIAAIDAMLAEDAYADCPPFLQEDSTVRALQKIIHEAGSMVPDGEERLSTAAAVARERLRSRLQAMRDQFSEEADNQDERADLLRQRLHGETGEVEHLQQVMQEELDRTASPSPTTSAGE
jgi:hypothetical protein